METSTVTSVGALPVSLQAAAKCALAVGAAVKVNADGSGLLVQFAESDMYYFDPENISMHALEMLGHARTFGFVQPTVIPDEQERPVVAGFVRVPLVIRTVFSAGDVRVQIGASRWYVDEHTNTATAMRHALIKAFTAYYDEAIAPYSEA